MYRMGIGYDAHKFMEGRLLVIGGVIIEYARGLTGHSDADVLVHAIMDALLGAASLGDIGIHFPDTDPGYSGADSLELLKEVKKMLDGQGYRICNIDTVIIAQEPRMRPYICEMKRNIAGVLGIFESQLNLKATTTEGLGFEGRKEGIAAHAIALIAKKPEEGRCQ